MQQLETWIKAVEERADQARHGNAEVKPTDSVSMVSFTFSSKSRRRGSDTVSKVSSSASPVHLKAEVERAPLLAKAAAL